MERGIGATRDLVSLLDTASPYVLRFARWEREQALSRQADPRRRSAAGSRSDAD